MSNGPATMPLFSDQEDSDTRRFLQALREMGVTHYEGLLPCWSAPVKLVLGPCSAPPAGAVDEERPLPKPPRTLEERLFDPLGIGGKDGKG